MSWRDEFRALGAKMSLVRRNPVVLIVLGFLLFVAIQYLVSRVFILQGFQQLEIKQTQRDAERVTNALADKIAQMKITAKDYASWDASYQFIEDANLAYKTENLTEDVLANLNLDFMLFVNKNGKVVDSLVVESASLPQDQIVQDLVKNPSWDALSQNGTTSSFKSGIIVMDKAPLMLASLPILTSLSQGPVRGSLVVGRYLNQAELDKLGEQTQIIVSIQRIDTIPLPADVAYYEKKSSPKNQVVLKPLDAHILYGYFQARDISGKPAFLFRMELPRETNQQGQTTLDFILVWTIVSGLLFSGVLYAFARILNRTREEKRSSEEFFKTVFNSINDVIFIHDSQTGTILDVNEKVVELFGYTHSEAVLLDIQAISSGIPPFTQQDGLQWIGKAVSQGPQHFEWQAKDKSGRFFWVDINMRLASFATQDRVLVSVRDISEHKRAEEDRMAREIAERANRTKSEFLSRMSHELRTPLNAILGFSQLLKMDNLKAEQARGVDYINTAGRHLLNLVNQVLDIAKIESGKLQLSTEAIRLEAVVNEALELIRPLAEARHVSLGFEAPSRDDLSVSVDRQGLRQVLLNLLSNAVKYNREGGKITVTTRVTPAGYLRLQVRDTGQGIAPEKMDRLFVPFDRLDMEAVEQEGTGLGLALSKGLMEAMGGGIGAESSPGEGSTFWLELKMITERPEALKENK